MLCCAVIGSLVSNKWVLMHFSKVFPLVFVYFFFFFWKTKPNKKVALEHRKISFFFLCLHRFSCSCCGEQVLLMYFSENYSFVSIFYYKTRLACMNVRVSVRVCVCCIKYMPTTKCVFSLRGQICLKTRHTHIHTHRV